MPRKYDLVWDPGNRRWRKRYGGKDYVISCRQLTKWSGKSFPPTKEGSAQIANEWWVARQAEIDGQTCPHPHAEEVEKLRYRRDWHRRRGERVQAEFYDRQIRILLANPSERSHLEINREFRRVAIEAQYGPSLADLPENALAYLADDKIWDDRMAREASDPVPEERTLGALISRYLAIAESRAQAGELSPADWDQARISLDPFREWAGAETSIDEITASRWGLYFSEVMRCEKSTNTKKARWRHARSFLVWVAEEGIAPRLVNLYNKKYRFGSGTRSVPTLTLDEVKVLLRESTGHLRLHLLLMLNCGMTQVDVANLRHDEIDWEEGRITRKRTKTKDQEDVPVVSYRLWPETFALLREHRKEGEWVLLTARGNKWLRDEVINGKRRKVDAFASIYVNFKRKMQEQGITIRRASLIRKTSASLLDKHDHYGRYAQEFLGHAPESITDRHYKHSSEETFDRAMAWLGKQYGFVD